MPKGAEGMPGVILPRKTVNELFRLIEASAGEITVGISSAKARFEVGTLALTSKLIDGTFPDYGRVIPKANAEAVWRAKDATFDVARIDEIEAVTKHDVIAFLTHLGEIIGQDEARFVHQGMTSSDVLDTC